jgi:hypothetical protein
LSWKIYQNLTDQKDLACAITLINRSIELEENNYNLQTKAHLLHKIGENKEALKTAKAVKKGADRKGVSTVTIQKLIDKIEAE